MEWISFLKLDKDKLDKYMLKLQVAHLCSEDLIFMGVSIFLQNFSFMEHKFNYTALISLVFTCISCITVKNLFCDTFLRIFIIKLI